MKGRYYTSQSFFKFPAWYTHRLMRRLRGRLNKARSRPYFETDDRRVRETWSGCCRSNCIKIRERLTKPLGVFSQQQELWLALINYQRHKLSIWFDDNRLWREAEDRAIQKLRLGPIGTYSPDLWGYRFRETAKSLRRRLKQESYRAGGRTWNAILIAFRHRIIRGSELVDPAQTAWGLAARNNREKLRSLLQGLCWRTWLRSRVTNARSG